MEEDQRDAQGSNTSYPPEVRRPDEDARVQAHVARHPGDFQRVEEKARRQAASAAGKQGSIAGVGQATASSDSGATGTSRQAATAPDAPSNADADAAKAAECLNQWRRDHEQAMYDKCRDDVEINEQAVQDAMTDLGAGSVQEAEKILEGKAALARREVTELRAAKATPAQISAARGEAWKAAVERNAFCKAKCMAEQGRRLRGRNPRTNARAA